jgi:hypothetical protein
MPILLPTDLPTIMEVVITQLTTFTSTLTTKPPLGDPSNAYCILDEEPPPGRTGQRDVLIASLPDKAETIQGTGRDCRIYSGLQIFLRSQLALDPAGTRLQWLLGNRTMVNGIMDALMGFFPVDSGQNAYTIEGFVLDANERPAKSRATTNWGECIGTYRFHYLPKIDKTVLG